jgi:hypothetical protein
MLGRRPHLGDISQLEPNGECILRTNSTGHFSGFTDGPKAHGVLPGKVYLEVGSAHPAGGLILPEMLTNQA